MARRKSKKRIAADFIDWLGEQGFTTLAFSEKVGIPYETVVRWRQARATPRPTLAGIVRDKFPDCPLVAQ